MTVLSRTCFKLIEFISYGKFEKLKTTKDKKTSCFSECSDLTAKLEFITS